MAFGLMLKHGGREVELTLALLFFWTWVYNIRKDVCSFLN